MLRANILYRQMVLTKGTAGSAIQNKLNTPKNHMMKRSIHLISGGTRHNAMYDPYNPTEEHKALRDMVRNLSVNEIDPQRLEHDKEERFNADLFARCGELGLLGVTADVEYGGSGLDATAACIIHEEISQADPGFCLAYLAHSMLFVNNLNLNGTEEQKHRFLPKACSGDIIGGMAMSEPGAGTDVLGMKTVATRDGDNHYVLNGEKLWITNGHDGKGGTGDVYLVYARTGGPDSKSISLFLVEKGMEGFSVGQIIKNKCGMRASNTAELVFRDVRIPAANLVGQEGEAQICMMRNLEIERVVLGAMATGIARRCVHLMGKYSGERVAFGQTLSKFGQIQRYVSESYAQYMAGRAYLYQVANHLELESVNNRLDTDGVKLFTTTMSKVVADNAIQVHGGLGYCGEYQVEQLWRDAKLLEIGGGTLESHHKNMMKGLTLGLYDTV